MVVAHLRGKNTGRDAAISGKINKQMNDRKLQINACSRAKTCSIGNDSQEGVSGSVPYVSQCIHINVVVVQLFREGGAACLCKQHTQPAA